MFYFNGTRKPNFSNIKKIDYDQYWRERGFGINKKLKEREHIILDLISNGSKVCDIGCGSSLLPIKLKDKGIDISVADISDVVLESFNSEGVKTKRINLEDIDGFNLNEKFNYIILSEVLEHTKNPEEIISKLKKSTENFIVTIPNSAFYRYRLHLLFFGRFFTQWVYHPSEHIRFWSHIDFLDWLDALGLKVLEVKSSNGFSFFGLIPNLKNLFKNLFGHQIVYLCKVEKK